MGAAFPCLRPDEQAGGPHFVTVKDSMSAVPRSQGRRTPASPHLLSGVAIVTRLAQATWPSDDSSSNSSAKSSGSSIDWASLRANYAEIRALIEDVIPGFRGKDGASYEERSLQGFVLPNGARERRWRVEGGDRARFTPIMIPQDPRGEGQLLMMTVRSHDQYNTTIYGWDDRYRGIYGGRRVVMMSAHDMHNLGLTEGDLVDIKSHFDGEEREVKGFKVIPQSIPTGCVATYFPEANPLVPARQTARISNTPASKSVVVTIQRNEITT